MEKRELREMASVFRNIEKEAEMLFCEEKTGKHQYDIFIFEQLWGNTSGGFEGWGGSAMTTAMTIVLVPKDEAESNKCFVFFSGAYAYTAPKTERFLRDVQNRNVLGKVSSKEYWAD